jgi:hypothetical protein
MRLPFTADQFLDAFARFNQEVWPLQLVAYALGVLAVVLAIRGGRGASRGAGLVLAFLWAAAAAYHAAALGRLATSGAVFAAAFVLQAMLLATAATRRRLSFRAAPGALTTTGLALILYATAIYPLLGLLAGHPFPRGPVFGVTPCPNVIFTFGLLLLSDRPVPRWLLPIPLLWSMIGFTAAMSLGMIEDLPLPFAALLATVLLLFRDRPHAHRPAPRGAAVR